MCCQCPTCGKRLKGEPDEETVRQRREHRTAYMRRRYQTDPAFRDRQKARVNAYRARLKAQREAEQAENGVNTVNTSTP